MASVSIGCCTSMASFRSTTGKSFRIAVILSAVALAGTTLLSWTEGASRAFLQLFAEPFAAASDCTTAGVDISAAIAIFFSVSSSSEPFLAGEIVPLPAASANDGKSSVSLLCLRASYRSFACFIVPAEGDEEALGGGIPDFLGALVGVDTATGAAAVPLGGGIPDFLGPLVGVDAATAAAAAPAGVLGAGLF